PFAAAPALERGPQAAIEAEAVDRRRRIERADAVEADAGPLEAAFFEHAARGRIAHARPGNERVVAEVGEGMVDHGARGFGGIAVAPVGHAEHIAELGRLPVAPRDPAGAEEGAG